jgi:C4-dicarboxylate-specific signal transduction histidine kinase
VKRAVDVAELIREVLALVRPEILRHRTVIREALASDLPPILGDRIHLQQVVINLIVNVTEAMTDVDDSGRSLAISAERHGEADRPGRRSVTVQDAGVGIPAGAREPVLRDTRDAAA